MKYLLLLFSMQAFGMGAFKDFCKHYPSVCEPEEPKPEEPKPDESLIKDPEVCTSFLFDNNETTTHRLLSNDVPQAQRDEFIGRLLKLKYNTISLQLVSLKSPSVQYDHSKKDFWISEIQKMRAKGLKVVMWLRSDNAPKWTLQQWKDYLTTAIADLDSVVDIWTAGIENDEYWSEAETHAIVAHMKSKTSKLVGVHTTPTLHHANYAATADVFFLQTGFGVSAAQVRDQLNGARKLFPSKKIMLSEYHKDGPSNEAIELCAQGLDTGVPMGCMTGCAGRKVVVAPPPPPAVGCPAGGSKSNLIKPESDNDKKLVILVSCEYLKNTSQLIVSGEKGRDSTNYTTLPNGARVHFRYSKPGKNFGTQNIELQLKNGSKLCYKANLGVRSEGWKFSACGGTVVNPPIDPPVVVVPSSKMKALFFMEAGQGTTNYGFKDPYILAMNGKVVGAHNYKLIHPWYEPFKAPMNESQIRSFVKKAKSEGYEGVSLDHEGQFLASPKILEWIYTEAKANGLQFINVPAVHLKHQVDAWKYSEKQVIEVFQKFTDASAIWNYSLQCDGYMSYINKWRSLGYTKQLWAMGDDGFRPTYGGIDPDEAAGTAKCLASKGYPFSVFNPKSTNSKVIQMMKSLYL